MTGRNLDYEIRRRAELKSKLGLRHIQSHVSAVLRVERVKAAAEHLYQRVKAARCTAQDITGRVYDPFKDERVQLALAKAGARMAVEELIESRGNAKAQGN